MRFIISSLLAVAVFSVLLNAEESTQLRKAFIDGTGDGWHEMGEEDFARVNCDAETFTFRDGKIFCTGKPIGVLRTKKQFTNFEYVIEWCHREKGGNSGTFIWVPESAVTDLPPNKLPPGGIEVQILDHGYAEKYKASTGKDPDWFTSNGDIFAVGSSQMKPFPPLSPNGSRSFPTKNLSKGVDEWNHYYVRAMNGEVRLWVNGEEVSGGSDCNPSSGYLCLEAEGAPIEFRNFRIRELP